MKPNCLACGSSRSMIWTQATDLEYFSTNEIFKYYKCLHCGSLYIDPVPIDRLSVIYPKKYYSFSEEKNFVRSIKEYLDKLHFKKLLENIKKDQINALDIGGGTGWLLSIIKKLDKRVTFTQVVDIDKKAASYAIRRGHGYFCGRIEEFNTDKKFDLILLLNLIEHVGDPKALLTKVRNILSDDGIILIKTPNTESIDERLFRHMNWTGYHCPRHWILFSQNSLRRLIKCVDLRINKFSYTQGGGFWATSIIIWLARHGIVSINKERPAIFHPLFPPLAAIFAAFDFMRTPFSKPSQMFVVLSKPK